MAGRKSSGSRSSSPQRRSKSSERKEKKPEKKVEKKPEKTTAPPPTTQQTGPAPTTQQTAPQQGPGLMGTFVSSMAGSVIGHAVSNSLFGGDKKESKENERDEESADEEEFLDCKEQEREFQDCLKQNGNDIKRCQFNFDIYQQCKVEKFNKMKF